MSRPVDASLERLGLVVVTAALGSAAGYAVGRFAPVAGPAAEASTGLTEQVGPKNPRLAAAGRRGITASGMNARRYRCKGCGMETTAGPLTRHQQATGHDGRASVPGARVGT